MVTILRYLSGFTVNFWLIVVGVLSLALAVQTVRIEGFLFFDGYKDEIAAHKAIAAKALEKARQADQDAAGAVKGTQADIEAGNERARSTASQSDDPLRDGLGVLR